MVDSLQPHPVIPAHSFHDTREVAAAKEAGVFVDPSREELAIWAREMHENLGQVISILRKLQESLGRQLGA